MIQANLSPGDQSEFTTHYVACWVQDNCQIRCWHQHKIISEAANCIQTPGGFIRAVSNGRERCLTYEEQEQYIRALLTLYIAERDSSRRDGTTGALNERGFREQLSHEMSRFRRHQRPLTVVYLDLDGFKTVNDTLGHSTGNVVLRVVAQTMQRSVRDVDFVARLHGDEFALLLPETSGKSARVVVEKLKNTLSDTMKAHEWNVTFSIGVVTFKSPPAAADYMIETADKAMYTVKRTGKDRISSLVVD